MYEILANIPETPVAPKPEEHTVCVHTEQNSTAMRMVKYNGYLGVLTILKGCDGKPVYFFYPVRKLEEHELKETNEGGTI